MAKLRIDLGWEGTLKALNFLRHFAEAGGMGLGIPPALIVADDPEAFTESRGKLS
jgi:hypothetical protein